MVTIKTTRGMTLLQLIVQIIWLFLPALAANSAPVVATRAHWLPQLAVPIDGNRLYKGQPLFGHNKTWRGVVVGLLFGSIAGILQYSLQPQVAPFVSPLWIYASPFGAVLWGSWLALGALGGDLLKSFFKRRLLIAPSEGWIPFDQIDMVVGVWCLTIPFINVSWAHIAVSFIMIGMLMYLTSAIGVKIKIKAAT